MNIRRQLINLSDTCIDFRLGFGAMDQLPGLLKSVVALPKRALLVSDKPSFRRFGDIVERSLIDAGFAVEPVFVEEASGSYSLEDAAAVFRGAQHAALTSDDLIVALGDADVCGLVSWCAKSWQGGVSSALIPLTLDAMVCSATGMKPISAAAGELPSLSLFPEPDLVVCDLSLAAAAEPESLKLGYVEGLLSAFVDSRSRWDDFGRIIPELIDGDEISLIDCVGWAQGSRRDVVCAANIGARSALDFGCVSARALASCLGHSYPGYQLRAEGMRFEARLAHEICDFDLDDVFELDDRFDDLGIDEAGFTLDVQTFVSALHKERLCTSNRFLFALPQAIGTVRLTSVDDDVLMRHAEAYLSSRADIARSAC